MTAPLAEVTSEAMRTSASENLHALFRAMADLPGAEIEEGHDLSRHMAFPTNPMFKGAWATRLDPALLSEAIEDTIAWFKSRGAPFFFWWTGPASRPDDLGARLAAHGLASMEEQQRILASGIVQSAQGAAVMALDFGRADFAALERVPPGFVIREAESEAALLDFKRVFVETYHIPDWAGQAWVDATLAAGLKEARWRIHVGYLDGDPVACSFAFEGGGVVSPYAVATLPKAQRRGLGGAITLAPLRRSLAGGCRWAALFSTEEGYPVYRRLGFQDTGARINRYLWRE